MTKAELIAENRPACGNKLDGWRNQKELTHKNQGGIEVLVVLPDIVRVIFSRLFLVRSIEVEACVVTLDGLEEHPESILEAMSVRRSAT